MDRKIGDITVRELLMVVAAAVLLLLLWRLSDVLMPFAVALGLAYVLNPLLEFLDRYRVGRITGIWLILLAVLSVAATALAFLVPAVQEEVGVLVANAPLYAEKIRGFTFSLLERFGIVVPETGAGFADFLVERIRGISPEVIPTVAAAIFKGVGGTFSLAMGFLNLLIIPVMTFYLLKDFHALKESIYSLIPRQRLPGISGVLSEIDDALSSFVRGQLLVCVILGVLYSVGLLAVGVDLAILIGLISGLISFIPYLGLMVGMAVSVVMAAVKFGDIFHPAMAALVFVVVQTLEGTVISPRIVGEKVGLHPVTVILAVMIGGALMGFVGILIAVPVAAAINVLVRHAAGKYRASPVYGSDVRSEE